MLGYTCPGFPFKIRFNISLLELRESITRNPPAQGRRARELSPPTWSNNCPRFAIMFHHISAVVLITMTYIYLTI
jgi:hypothetical protein